MSEVSIKCNPKLAAAVNECIELIGELDKDKALEFCASYCAEFVARTFGIIHRRASMGCLDIGTLIIMLIASSVKLAEVLMSTSASESGEWSVKE